MLMDLISVLMIMLAFLLNNAGEIRGSRIFGPVARELRATKHENCFTCS